MTVNKKYKDSLFRHLFNDKSRLLELYNAIMGANFQDESIIEINTLEDVLFASKKNDISFTVNKKMVVLIEHQSSINENMPFRILSYIVRIYEEMINTKIYRKSREKLPRPEFIVLYNGEAPFPDEKILRLSDAFEELEESEKTVYSDLFFLDVLVVMLNINKGRNPELARKSKALNGYAVYIAKVREYEKKYPLKEALKLAVDYCIKNGILEDYFKHNSTEVISMTFLEYNEKDARRELRKEAREEGKKEVQDYILSLIDQGLSREEIKKKIEKMSKKK
jgi:hypothetical protein